MRTASSADRRLFFRRRTSLVRLRKSFPSGFERQSHFPTSVANVFRFQPGRRADFRKLRRAQARGDASCRSRPSRDAQKGDSAVPGSRIRVLHVERIGLFPRPPTNGVGRDSRRRPVSRNLHRAGKRIRSRRSIYKGKVTRVLLACSPPFVDIGLDGDAFLYVSDVFETSKTTITGIRRNTRHLPRPLCPLERLPRGSASR